MECSASLATPFKLLPSLRSSRPAVGPAPAVLVVEAVAQRVKGLLPAGRRDVEAAARLQVAPCGEHMHVHPAAALAVLDRRPRVAIGLKPRPGRVLELVEDGVDLRFCRTVFRRPGDHARRVLVLELQRVGDGRHPLVFPSKGRNPISITRLPRLLQNHKIAAVPHGFHSSFRDWAAEETNHPREVVETSLAHVVGNQTEAAYARSPLCDRRRRLMQDWANYLDGYRGR